MFRRWKTLRARLILGGIAVAILLPLAVLVARTRFELAGEGEGLYLLRDQGDRRFVLTNKLFLGEEGRLLTGLDFPPNEAPVPEGVSPWSAYLALDWDEEEGFGIVRSHLGNGRLLQTHFSRYLDSNGRHTNGLFVGGAIPEALTKDSPWHENDSGMAYFDGSSWQHIWCNTNEGIGSLVNYRNSFAPSAWTYRGSSVLESSPEHLLLSSFHEVVIDEVPLRIERTVDFTAGEPYFNLAIKITNVGPQAIHYYYYYGDEPWVGDFGSSAGDVGWTADGLVRFEGRIDPARQSFAGMVDYGNEAIGEGRNFRHTANFIEWFGPNRPDTVFFANRYDGFNHPAEVRVPLQGDARSIGMYWGPRTIRPGETQSMLLAIGMAQWAADRDLPLAPVVNTRAHLGHLLTVSADPYRHGGR